MCIVHNHGIKLLTGLRVELSHLREHKFRHNFQDSLDQFCSCGRHNETTIHFFLHCSNYSNQRKTLFGKIGNIKRSLLNQNDSIIVENLLFGSTGLNDEENACIIESTIEYVITTERFITPLLWIFLSKSPLFLRSLIDCGSPYVILFSCLVVQFFFIYVYIYFFNALLNVYQQVYVACNLFFLIFFIFYCVYHIHRKKNTSFQQLHSIDLSVGTIY